MEIKSCPFCGAHNQRGRTHLAVCDFGTKEFTGPFSVFCKFCETYGPTAPTEGEAISRWNIPRCRIPKNLHPEDNLYIEGDLERIVFGEGEK